ncbi:hypothetical protein D6817_05700, partial [Candidatus Pacearchaeota archaeon]
MEKRVFKLAFFSLAVVVLTLFAIASNASSFALVEKLDKVLTFIPVFYGNTGIVSFVIEGSAFEITIHSPENTTYNFSVGENYSLDLNVSAGFTVDTWWYTLYDLRHNETARENVTFTPNTTIQAVRWNNKLVVYANDSGGNVANASVEFFVFVPNTAPVFVGLDNEVFVCEDSSLNYKFNATDPDEDNLTLSLIPTNPFYISPEEFFGQVNITSAILSGVLHKSDVGTYQETLSVNDNYNSTCCVDTAQVNITVIEINHAPSVETIGVRTIWSQGDNSSLYEEVSVSDIESGTQTSGNFSFNLTFLNGQKFFDISPFGVINFTANDSVVGAYNISLCVTDQALANPHENISLCGQDGSNLTSCQNFSLTVTNENRAPQITSYYPTELNFTSQSTSTLEFNITEHDPDGSIPDAYWYVDGIFKEYDTMSLTDSFSYTFGCGVSGEHNVSVVVTDGLLNTSLTWNITLQAVSCISAASGGGSGGGGGGGGGGAGQAIEKAEKCEPLYVCETWGECKNAIAGIDLNEISAKEFNLVKRACDANSWSRNVCGYQRRECFDLNSCNATSQIDSLLPKELRACYYTSAPSCSDNIRNCHDGA